MIPGVNGRDALRLLFDLGGDIFESNTRAARDAVSGCRLAVELLLCDLLAKVHQGLDAPLILRAVEESFMPYFLEPYIFSADGFQRKAILILTNIMVKILNASNDKKQVHVQSLSVAFIIEQ